MKKIITILLMLSFIFMANAEIHKGKVDGNKTYYAVVNKQINAVYVCRDVDATSLILETVQELGMPSNALPDNKLLDPEVATITKKHGNSTTFYQGYIILNTYDDVTGTYQTFIW